MNRTNTTARFEFELPPPDSASFDLADPKLTRITIPPQSTWRVPYHWHRTTCGCRFVISLEGPIRIYASTGFFSNYDRLGGAGTKDEFRPEQHVAWSRNRWSKDKDTALTAAFAADPNLYRNICSASLDWQLFPYLSSTPIWLKALLGMLTLFPTLRQYLLDRLWSLQLQMIYYAHDCSLYYGCLPIMWPWTNQPFGGRPPAWVGRLAWTSVHVISRVVMMSGYAIGRWLCGMKGKYPEYTVSLSPHEEKATEGTGAQMPHK